VPICYVATPFGKKTNYQTGRVVDHDDVYLRAIKPAAELAGCQVIRIDEDTSGGIMQKSILRLCISSDIFIADLGDGNPNVMYEVGVRHAARRGSAILVAPAGNRLPFNISNSRVFIYQVDETGGLDPAETDRLRTTLQSVIQQGLADQRNDSPVFEFFPGYTVELPDDMRQRESKSRSYPPDLKEALSSRSDASPRRKKKAAQDAEEIVKSTAPDDPAAALDVLKKYRDLGAWDDLIRFAAELPPPVAELGQIQQMLALALNRRNHPGDRDRAVALMEQLVAKTGGDGETHGILGRIYKDRFAVTGDQADILNAIAHYRAGFEKEPSDYYPGVNLVNLLAVYGGQAGKQELTTVLPRVRSALTDRIDPERPDYWELATALELAAIAGDWSAAQGCVSRILKQPPEKWMIETTVANLNHLEQAMTGSNLQNLQSVEELLRSALKVSAEVDNA
jgi:hypothetical protein